MSKDGVQPEYCLLVPIPLLLPHYFKAITIRTIKGEFESMLGVFKKPNRRVNSIKYSLVAAMMTISAVSLVASVASSTIMDISRQKADLVSQSVTYLC